MNQPDDVINHYLKILTLIGVNGSLNKTGFIAPDE
jgi:hypothetical protein